MNHYLVSIIRYFSGEEYFILDAENKTDAKERMEAFIFTYSSSNYQFNSIKVCKKLREKKIPPGIDKPVSIISNQMIERSLTCQREKLRN